MMIENIHPLDFGKMLNQSETTIYIRKLAALDDLPAEEFCQIGNVLYNQTNEAPRK